MSTVDEKYYLLKFYRKAIHAESNQSDHGEEALLTMDYFDALKVKSFEPREDILRQFMGLSVSEELTENDTAMQSIPAYRPKLDAKEYFCANPFYGDPLLVEEKDEEGFYLGIIQVYITPEMMARFMCERQNRGEDRLSGLAIYDMYYRDLHAILAGYADSLQAGSAFSYGIYKSLSIGDFIVAVKCVQPDVPFRIAALIRRRKLRLELSDPLKENTPHENLVFYKTYTSLCMNTHVLATSETEKASMQGDGYVVLRCVLSNKYWSDENETGAAEKYDLNAFADSAICLRLNGRYDFTAILGMEAFSAIFPVLLKYKLGQGSCGEPSFKGTEEEVKFCTVLCALIEGGYVSHVNERFVFSCNVEDEGTFYSDLEERERNGGLSIALTAGEQRLPYLNTVIGEKIGRLLARIRKVYRRVLMIDTSKRSLVYSIRLLEKLTHNCSSINGSSDSRIYASMIMDQIGAVLDGTEEYLHYLDGEAQSGQENASAVEEEYDDIINLIDEGLKKSVEYINLFSKYVLDSSLQSLQTPHYNLETHVSAEKLLMAYSSFMRRLLEWYSANSGEIGAPSFEFVPVMVPQPINYSLITELPFAWSRSQDKGINSKAREDSVIEKLPLGQSGLRDKGISSKAGDVNDGSAADRHLYRKRLLSVLCPSFNELTDFAGVMGNLFHETAHYLRYENRKNRNEVLLRCSGHMLFTLAAKSIAKEIGRNMGTFADGNSVELLLQEILASAYSATAVRNYPDFHDITGMRYIHLLSAIEDCYAEFISGLSFITDLRAAIEGFTTDPRAQYRSGDFLRCLDLSLELMTLINAGSVNRPLRNSGRGEAADAREWEDRYARKMCELYTGLDRVRGSKLSSAANLLSCIEESLNFSDKNEPYLPGETVRAHRTVADFCDVLNSSFEERVSEKGMSWVEDWERGASRGVRLLELDARKLRRMLGIDTYKTRYKADYFSDFVSLHLITFEKTAFRYFKSIADLYCEASSDLFMVEMLGMTEYGYLNYFSRYIPVSDHMNTTYMKRLSMVLYALSEGKLDRVYENGDGALSGVWLDIFCHICEHIRSFCEYNGESAWCGSISIKHGRGSSSLADVMKRLARMADDSLGAGCGGGIEKSRERSARDIEDFIRNFVRVSGRIRSALDQMISEHIETSDAYDAQLDEHVRGFILELRRCRYLCSNFLQLLYEYDTVYEELEQFGFIAEDLIRGDRNLRKLHREFVRNDEIWKYCRIVRDCYNKSDLSQYMFSELSTCMTEFVLDMHYRLMFESAAGCMQK